MSRRRTRLKSLEPEVTLSGASAQRVFAGEKFVYGAIIYSDTGNSSAYVGGSDVNSDNGFPLAAEESFDLGAMSLPKNDDSGFDLGEVYLIGTQNDTFRVLYFEKAESNE